MMRGNVFVSYFIFLSLKKIRERIQCAEPRVYYYRGIRKIEEFGRQTFDIKFVLQKFQKKIDASKYHQLILALMELSSWYLYSV